MSSFELNFLAVVGGILTKFYDDIKDCKLITDDAENCSLLIGVVKILLVAIIVCVSVKDSYISLLMLFTVPVMWYLGQSDIAFWTLLIPVVYISFLFTQKSTLFAYFSEKLLLILLSIVFVYVEAVSFPEEMSQRKTLFRSMFILVLAAMIYSVQDTRFQFIEVSAYLGIGYFASGLVFQFFLK